MKKSVFFDSDRDRNHEFLLCRCGIENDERLRRKRIIFQMSISEEEK